MFFEDLEKNELLDDFVDIIMSDNYFVSVKDPNLQNEEQVINSLKTSAKKIISLCNKKTKESIKNFLLEHEKLSKYAYIMNDAFLNGNDSFMDILYESNQVDVVLKIHCF